jgi:hypothetical protein
MLEGALGLLPAVAHHDQVSRRGESHPRRSQNRLCGIRHNGLYVESIMLNTSRANRISPAHAQLTFNIIKRAEEDEDRPAGSVSDPTFGGQ